LERVEQLYPSAVACGEECKDGGDVPAIHPQFGKTALNP
jgi:hypothetical protein